MGRWMQGRSRASVLFQGFWNGSLANRGGHINPRSCRNKSAAIYVHSLRTDLRTCLSSDATGLSPETVALSFVPVAFLFVKWYSFWTALATTVSAGSLLGFRRWA